MTNFLKITKFIYSKIIVVLIDNKKWERKNLKTGVSRKQSTPNFPKNEPFLPADTHTYVALLPAFCSLSHFHLLET